MRGARRGLWVGSSALAVTCAVSACVLGGFDNATAGGNAGTGGGTDGTGSGTAGTAGASSGPPAGIAVCPRPDPGGAGMAGASGAAGRAGGAGASGVSGGAGASDGAGASGASGGAGMSYEQIVHQDGPRGYYRFEEVAPKAQAADSSGISDPSGNKYYCTYGTAVVLVPGCSTLGQFAYFNGASDSRIDCGNLYDYANTQSGMSVEAWVFIEKENFGGGRHPRILGREGNQSADPSGYVLNTFVQTPPSNDSLLGFIVSNGPHSNTSINAPAGPLINVWHHVVATYELSADMSGKTTTSLYVDGMRSNDLTKLFTLDKNADATFSIGGTKVNDGNNFVGGIDEVVIYGKALSQPQIQAHADAVLHASPTQ